MSPARANRTPAILVALFLLLIHLGHAQAPAIPSTPAGQVLQTWLDAFNSGDRAKIESYVKNTNPKDDVDGLLSFRDSTGGFDLLSIDPNSTPLEIKFRVKEKAGTTTAFGTILVKDTHPPTVDSFGLRALPPGAVIEDITVDAAARQRVLDGIYKNLDDYYLYPDIAKKMEDTLRDHQKRGDYDSITNGNAFATRLTDDMRDVSHDKHLGVAYNPFKTPPPPPDQHGPSPEDLARFHKSLERNNCGFVKVEILPHNIGYLKFNQFGPPDACGPTVIAAMTFLAHVDAIIFDLRTNGGGDPAMVAFIASWLFDHPTHLSDIYNRREDSTTQYWTTPYVASPRLANTPAFILTSKRTFSGAEDFTYNLKIPKRATVIGETTGGGAHPVGGHRIDDHFSIGVPFARSINLTTKTNWEGTGVEPDVKVPAADALDTATKLAIEKIQTASSNEPLTSHATSLEKTNWQLTQLGTTAITADPQRGPSLTLNPEQHRVSGAGGCNRIKGGYTLESDKLKFTQMASTMMACPNGMDTERAFLKALNQVTSWKINGDKLELLDASGKTIATFQAAANKE